ncbi:hypothetical protein EVJ33_06550 [Exiguobacterium sp. SL-10]|jgi:hypothetical protein|uniref:hypothetical protein n=1 Tax=Exiguobacterium sp. SL-10 TaxID=2510962 RepID=UPI00103A098E|nr:hypothetical protein [Exiguobacterium sp. SL-10]TCI30319.1 hypothetical protein EVJ33_06550 [Exiguobacterium sp. SL-10]
MMIRKRYIRPAIYHYFPMGDKDMMHATEEQYRTKISFRDYEASSSLYVQMFDQKFDVPPSKIYRPDAKLMDANRLLVEGSFEANLPIGTRIEVYYMQYNKTKRIVNLKKRYNLKSDTFSFREEIELEKGAEFFKLAFKFYLTDSSYEEPYIVMNDAWLSLFADEPLDEKDEEDEEDDAHVI